MSDGVMVGSDRNQEWMLPWWWKHYSKYSFLPVAFADFGMSEKAREWCRNRGQLLSIDTPTDFISSKSAVDKSLADQWEKEHQDKVWASREGWLKKPLAMTQTPFERTLWTDLDCEIIGSITPLFQKIHLHSGIAMAKEVTKEAAYNSGVVIFSRTSHVVQKWAEICLHQNAQHLSDQTAINSLIHKEEIEIAELPAIYNWHVSVGVNIEAVILHWMGAWGKEVIHLAMQR
jgi:hypothetical protein